MATSVIRRRASKADVRGKLSDAVNEIDRIIDAIPKTKCDVDEKKILVIHLYDVKKKLQHALANYGISKMEARRQISDAIDDINRVEKTVEKSSCSIDDKNLLTTSLTSVKKKLIHVLAH